MPASRPSYGESSNASERCRELCRPAMPPEDDFTREGDPRKQTTATIIGLVVAAALVAVGIGVWLTRAQSPPTGVVPLTSTPSPTAPEPSRPSPTPVPSAPVLGPGFSVAEDGVARELVTFGGVD